MRQLIDLCAFRCATLRALNWTQKKKTFRMEMNCWIQNISIQILEIKIHTFNWTTREKNGKTETKSTENPFSQFFFKWHIHKFFLRYNKNEEEDEKDEQRNREAATY